MLPINYQYYSFAQVGNLANFYKGNQPELPKLKLIVENIKLLFKLPSTCVTVEVAEGERVYKVGMVLPGVHKTQLGYFVYIPGERRLDAYSAENPGTPASGREPRYPGRRGFGCRLRSREFHRYLTIS